MATRKELEEIVNFVLDYHTWCEQPPKLCEHGHTVRENCLIDENLIALGDLAPMCDGCKMMVKASKSVGRKVDV